MQYYGLEIMNKGENGMEKLGFIGLGIMGMPMARHLCEAGNEVWVNDVNSAACEAAQKNPGCARRSWRKSRCIFWMRP